MDKTNQTQKSIKFWYKSQSTFIFILIFKQFMNSGISEIYSNNPTHSSLVNNSIGKIQKHLLKKY